MSAPVYQNKQMAAMLTSAMSEIMQGALTHAMFFGDTGKERFLEVCEQVYDSAVKNIDLLSKSLDDFDAKKSTESAEQKCEP
jgi:hypothetical protein